MQKSIKPDIAIAQSFASLNKTALGISLGSTFGLLIFLMTVILVIKGGFPVGPNLSLIGQYFPGYTVSFTGSLIGFVYAFILGFSLGWIMALLYNLLMRVCLFVLELKSNLSAISDYIDVAEKQK